MTSSFHDPVSNFLSCVDCRATLERLVGNISGFIYRRRHDARWTMEFVSAGCRDITGYDPHRFIANQSLAFADLIARPDWSRVNEQVSTAVQHGRRVTLDYLIRAAHGAWVQVEDRLTPVVNAAGKVLAIEGVIDRARWPAHGADARPNHQLLIHN
jgi:PAS domain-containing protein